MAKQQLGLLPALTLDLVHKGYVDTAIAGVGSGGAGTPFGSTSVDNGDGTVTTTTVQLLDASTTAKGLIQLAGDLGGTAAAPTVTGLSGKAPSASPAFTGTPTAPTATTGTNTTQVATTAFVQQEATVTNSANSIVRRDSGGGIAASYMYNLGAPTTADGAANKGYVDTALALKANIASPTFTGTPAAPTPAANTNTTQLATTAFVVARTPTIVSSTTAPSSPAVGDLWVDMN